jgi:hemerythrin
MILWSKDFETGSAKLDTQHRLLIDNINLLEHQLHSTNPTMEELTFAVQLVDYLESYANIHFNCEEKCMQNLQCPAHAVNSQEHERFRGFIGNYKKMCEAEGLNVSLLRTLHKRIRAWIEEHILKIDTRLRPCITASMRIDPAALPE